MNKKRENDRAKWVYPTRSCSSRKNIGIRFEGTGTQQEMFILSECIIQRPRHGVSLELMVLEQKGYLLAEMTEILIIPEHGKVALLGFAHPYLRLTYG